MLLSSPFAGALRSYTASQVHVSQVASGAGAAEELVAHLYSIGSPAASLRVCVSLEEYVSHSSFFSKTALTSGGEQGIFAHVKCVALAAPCIVSDTLARSAEDYITSVVLADDAVCRWSLGSTKDACKAAELLTSRAGTVERLLRIRLVGHFPATGTQFTCFTSSKVQILTQTSSQPPTSPLTRRLIHSTLLPLTKAGMHTFLTRRGRRTSRRTT